MFGIYTKILSLFYCCHNLTHFCYNVTLLVCFIIVTTLHLFVTMLLFFVTMLLAQCYTSLSQCYFSCFARFSTHVMFRMNDFDYMHCFYDIPRAYCLFLLKFLIVYQKYFSLFLSRLHSNSFCLLITNGFDDVPLVVVILLDDNSGTHCTGRKLLSWTFISSVHSSLLSSLNVSLNLVFDRKLCLRDVFYLLHSFPCLIALAVMNFIHLAMLCLSWLGIASCWFESWHFLSPFCFNDFCKIISNFRPWYVIQWLHTWINTIVFTHDCSYSFLHNSSRNVSCTHNLSWAITDNVLRVNLTLTPLPPSVYIPYPLVMEFQTLSL